MLRNLTNCPAHNTSALNIGIGIATVTGIVDNLQTTTNIKSLRRK